MYVFHKYLFMAYFKTVKAISPPAKAIAVSTGDGSLLSGELTTSPSWSDVFSSSSRGGGEVGRGGGVVVLMSVSLWPPISDKWTSLRFTSSISSYKRVKSLLLQCL